MLDDSWQNASQGLKCTALGGIAWGPSAIRMKNLKQSIVGDINRMILMFMINHISFNHNADLTSDWIRFQRTVFAQDLLWSEVLHRVLALTLLIA
jgi:hypothetical protein